MDVQAKKLIDEYIKQDFPKEYDELESKKIWRAQSKVFQTFWESQVMSSSAPLTEDEMIPVIQILDVKGKRNTTEKKKVEGVAFTSIFQGT